MLEGWPGEKLLVTIYESFDRALTGILRPCQIIRVAEARAEARRIKLVGLANARRQVSAMAGAPQLPKPDSPLLLPTDQPPAILVREVNEHPDELAELNANREQREKLTGLNQQINLEKILIFTEEEAEQIIDKIGGSPDKIGSVEVDWLTRWRNQAKDVNREELQRLWARILIGEVASPGSFSLQTIDFLSKLNSYDAKIIEKVAKLQIESSILREDEVEFYKQFDINLLELLHLEDLGILSNVLGIGGLERHMKLFSFAGDKKGLVLHFRDCALRVMADESKSPQGFVLNVYAISRVGLEVMKLSDVGTPKEYIKHIAHLAEKAGFIEPITGIVEWVDDQSFRIKHPQKVV